METLWFWQVLCFACMFFMFYMYSILDGFDLGLGAMIGLVARNDDEKRRLLSTISPFWDGNEVWLVIAVSTLFAGFPVAYSKLLPAFYLPFLFIIICFICRAVSLEFSYSGKGVLKFPLAVFSVSSILASFSGIFFLSLIVSGLPSDPSGIPQIRAGYLLKPLPVLFAAAWITMMLMHTFSYLVRKTDGELKARIMRYAEKSAEIFLFLFIMSIVLLCQHKPNILAQPLAWIGAAMAFAGTLVYRFVRNPHMERRMFALTAFAMGGIWLLAAGAMLPNIVTPAQLGAPAMTVYNTSAPLETLKVVACSSLIGMAALIAYTFFVYRLFRQKEGVQ